MLEQKKGNVIIVVICLVVALMIALVYLLKSTTTRMYTTKKLGSTLYARELANTLAQLSIQHLKQELKNKNSKIVKTLSKPIDNFQDSPNEDLLSDLNKITTSDSNNIIELLSSKSGLNNLKIEKLYWKVFKDDFKLIDVNGITPYTTEKIGLVHIFMDFSYILPGKNTHERNKETYQFTSDVIVTANILPVLSRFSLYIDDALDGNIEDLERFNVIDTDANGVLNNKGTNVYIPWILNNHGTENRIDTKLNSFNKIIESSRGLVFLGGGDFGPDKAIKLGLSFGEAGGGSPYGEGFHFFYTEEVGYWKNENVKENFDSWEGNVGILTSNFGLCNDKETESNPFSLELDEEDDSAGDDDYSTYFEMTGGTDDDKKGSNLKLYGTDSDPSPTLVFGYVDSKYAAIKQFRFGDDDNDYDLLAFYRTTKAFKSASSYDYKTQDEAEDAFEDDENDYYNDELTDFAFKYRKAHGDKKLEHEEYLKLFSSKIESDGYNKGYPFALNHSEEFPFKKNVIEGNELKRLLNKEDKDILRNVPYTINAKYNEIYNDAQLGEIDKFLDINKLNISDFEKSNRNYKIAQSLKIISDEPDNKSLDYLNSKNLDKDFLKYLKTKGILVNNELNLNGWLFINNETDTDLTLNLKDITIVSHGGIILTNGNLYIKSDLKSSNNSFLTLVTLGDNKDIKIDEKVNNLCASLVSKGGQVVLKGRGNIPPLNVYGNIVMKKIHQGEKGLEGMMRGVKLFYNTNLSAKPFKNSNEENNLLMINLNDNPKILK